MAGAVFRQQRPVFYTVKAVQDGTFKGGEDAVFNLENEGVAVGKISPKVPREAVDR
jgi:basic membrane lipoprotein Med (substrate-binding protein (PBP1-ABC) superfamily)